MRHGIYTKKCAIKAVIMIALFGVLFYMPPGLAQADQDYFITIDGNGIDGFKPDIRSYDFEFEEDKRSVVIDVDTNGTDYVTGDLGRNKLSYGLNTFSFNIHQDIKEIAYKIYVVRNFPDGFKATDKRIEDYSKFQKDSRVDFFIKGIGFDFDGFDAVSLNDDVHVLLKDENRLRIRVDAKDINKDVFELLLTKNEKISIVSKESLNRYYAQKRNLIIVSCLLGIIISFLLIYFFKKNKPDI